MYKIVTTPRFDRVMKKLDRSVQVFLRAWIEKHLVGCENPRLFGKGLTANRSGFWRYRVGDYRILCSIEDDHLVLVLVAVGHHKEIYEA